MTTIKQKLTDEMKVVMKNKDSLKLSSIRLMLDRIQKKEKDDQKELSDQDVIQVLQTFKKQIEEEKEYFEKRPKDYNVDNRIFWLGQQLDTVNFFLPKQMNKEEVMEFIQQLLNNNSVGIVHNKGTLMKLVMPELKGKADNKTIGNIVDEILKGENKND